ncbi:heterokaryon incompatibility protein-domain-containing protein [Coniella lustricola]|uniref:Heterokaryon incompatibility protein-domain-containing protein n=1 Tax=Coniella lustricola TaxID=2025994 RepID=A0A2T2ZUQ4_9PEZI|nr:heterokaryon incompatibility protein-domain-containing protein [Coniella lustricola]
MGEPSTIEDIITQAQPASPPGSCHPFLCELCATHLSLDDASAGGSRSVKQASSSAGRSKSSNNSSLSTANTTLCFPQIETNPIDFTIDEITKRYRGHWLGGNSYTRRITLPDFPELVTPLNVHCKLCRTLKYLLSDNYAYTGLSSPAAGRKALQVEARYRWDASVACIPGKVTHRHDESEEVVTLKHNDLDFRLSYLDVSVKSLSGYMFRKFSFPVVAAPGQCKDWLHIRDPRLDLVGANSDSTLDMIQGWLDACENSTQCAQDHNDAGILPTRLVFLGDKTVTQPPRVVEFNDADSKSSIKYACLSYCWGTSGLPLKTTSKTLAEYKAGLPEREIPQLFRDAIFMTQSVGIQYLWIDALCILQDDKRDWERESALMSDIFRSAHITIGAAIASSCHDTLFQPRENPYIDIDFQSKLCSDVSGQVSIDLRGIQYSRSRFSWQADLQDSVWNTRGWVWQEQHIAQRLLIVGKRMVHLRCHSRLLSEDGGILDDFGHPSAALQHLDEEMAGWMDSMVEVASRAFTFPQDKLAAVAGLAKGLYKLQQKAGRKPVKYLAGHWQDRSLFASLQWIVCQPQCSFNDLLSTLLHNTDDYIAPSWSWASRNQGPLDFWDSISGGGTPRDDSRDRPAVCEVMCSDVHPLHGADALIKVAPGSSMTVRGKLRGVPVPPSLGQCKLGTKFLLEKVPRWQIQMPDGGFLAYFLDWDPRKLDCDDGGNRNHGADAAGEASESLLELLLTDDCEEMGLILYPVDAAAADDGKELRLRRFLRVGVFHYTSTEDEGHGHFESLDSDWRMEDVVLL